MQMFYYIVDVISIFGYFQLVPTHCMFISSPNGGMITAPERCATAEFFYHSNWIQLPNVGDKLPACWSLVDDTATKSRHSQSNAARHNPHATYAKPADIVYALRW